MNHNNCQKCSGLLVSEVAHDWATIQSLELVYCVNCGARFEKIMCLNRAYPPLAKDRRKLPRTAQMAMGSTN